MLKMSSIKTFVLVSSLKAGGAEYVAIQMSKYLPHTCLLVFENIANWKVESKYYYNMKCKIYNSYLLKVVSFIYKLLNVQYIKLKYQPETFISHLQVPNFINIISYSKSRKIIFVHNTITRQYASNKLQNKLFKYLIHKLYPKADIVVCVSEDIYQEITAIKHIDTNKVLYLDNPIDTKDIINKSQISFDSRYTFLINIKYIVSVASFSTQKNHTGLIDIYSKVVSTDNSIKLVLLGVGSTKNRICKQLDDLKLSYYDMETNDLNYCDQEVIFAGFLENPYPFIKNAEMMLLASFWEGLPIVVLEAMTLETIILTSISSSGIERIIFSSKKPIDVDKVSICQNGILFKNMYNRTQQENAEISDYVAPCILRIFEKKIDSKEITMNAKDYVKKHDVEYISKSWLKLI
jgi:glycosyltransferase involved in cell wall biosynthesis